MHRIDIDVVVLGLTLALAGGEGPDQPPEEEYRKLLDAYQKAGGGGASSDAERMKVIARVYRERSRVALQFVELARGIPRIRSP